jgi:hypothetical protein
MSKQRNPKKNWFIRPKINIFGPQKDQRPLSLADPFPSFPHSRLRPHSINIVPQSALVVIQQNCGHCTALHMFFPAITVPASGVPTRIWNILVPRSKVKTIIRFTYRQIKKNADKFRLTEVNNITTSQPLTIIFIEFHSSQPHISPPSHWSNFIFFQTRIHSISHHITYAQPDIFLIPIVLDITLTKFHWFFKFTLTLNLTSVQHHCPSHSAWHFLKFIRYTSHFPNLTFSYLTSVNVNLTSFQSHIFPNSQPLNQTSLPQRHMFQRHITLTSHYRNLILP